MRRQIALTLARTPGLHQHLTHLLERDRSGDHPKADVVADTHAGWQCGGSSTHGAYSPPVHSRLGDKGCNVNRIETYPEGECRPWRAWGSLHVTSGCQAFVSD